MAAAPIRRALTLGTVAIGTAVAAAPAAAHDAPAPAPRPETTAVVIEEAAGVRYAVPPAGSYDLPVIKPAPDGAVLDPAGTSRKLSAVAGRRIALLSFIYTRCADGKGCPLAAAVFYDIEDAMAKDPELATNLKLISLSFDPAHDTPRVMADYAGRHARLQGREDAPWAFLTTASPAELQPLLDGYGQYVAAEVGPDGEPTEFIDHILKVFLIDRKRRIRNIYSASFLYPELVLADVRTLLLEESASAGAR